ncbi:penicillin-binding protein activator [Klebsiella pneumoniae]|uniref:penicillin-binding protein activator n=1 Tax=Klebsiella pneumoniae TaxID=573 RepID=UPI00398824C6
MLALNQPEKVESRANLCYFALSPEDEARDAARHIHQQGKHPAHMTPLLLVPRGALGIEEELEIPHQIVEGGEQKVAGG